MPHTLHPAPSPRSQPAGDVNYGQLGAGYAAMRRTDPRIELHVHAALGSARTVLNVGAGSGSYEPTDREVIAIEPSAAMRELRPPTRVPAIDAVAENLPLADKSVDASMAIITVHQWRDLHKGLAELHRVTRGPIVILAFDNDAFERFWLCEYAPELAAVQHKRDPTIETLVNALSTPARRATVQPIHVPIDCIDGFVEAYYARPERYLDPAVTRAQSSWNFVGEGVLDRVVKNLAADLASGSWDAAFGIWRKMPMYESSLRLIVGGDPLP